MRQRSADILAIAAILLAGAATALWLGHDYGLSWDELGIAELGRAALTAYGTRSPMASLPADLALYGPAYAAFAEWLSDNLVRVAPSWTQIDARHVAYFAAFMIAGVSIYVLSRPFASPGHATVATTLFLSQPLLFGHAFINPKDMPFVGLFAVAMASGIVACRAAPPTFLVQMDIPLRDSGLRRRFLSECREAWQLRGRSERLIFLIFLTAAAALTAELLLAQRLVLPILRATIRDAYNRTALPVIQALFDRLATDVATVPLADYLHKGNFVYQWASIATGGVLLAVVVGWAYSFFRRPLLALYQEGYLNRQSATFQAGLHESTARRQVLVFPVMLMLAALSLGIATAIRPVAPLAGALITGLLLLRIEKWRDRVLAIVSYWAVALTTAVALWPFLWEQTLGRFLRAFSTMTNYPWQGAELFGGLAYTIPELPRYYGVFHFIVQLTLPAVLLGLSGIAFTLLRSKSAYQLAESLVLLAWLGGPFLFAAVFRTPLYDSARQLLFAITPLFVFSAASFAWLSERATRQTVRFLLCGLLVLPGAIGIATLHPYQYIYYNELVGGVAGANGMYELDYWGTSYREAMEYLATSAGPGARIAVPYFSATAWPYAREDFSLWRADSDDTDSQPDFAVVTTRANTQEVLWPEAPVIFEVERGGGVLAIVRDLRGFQIQPSP